MSEELEVNVRVKNLDDAKKLFGHVVEFNQEGMEQAGDPEYNPIHNVNWKYDYDTKQNILQLTGDCYDLGGFMINLFTQNVWQGGFGIMNGKELPVWDGTYDPISRRSVVGWYIRSKPLF